MAYVSQEMKAKLAPTIKAICKKYNVKASLAVRNHSTLVLNIKSGVIDFIGNFNQVTGGDSYGNPRTQNLDINPYWFHDHFDGAAKDFLTEIFTAMNEGNWDKSDIQTDYFNVGWYVDVNIGSWNKPYIVA